MIKILKSLLSIVHCVILLIIIIFGEIDVKQTIIKLNFIATNK